VYAVVVLVAAAAAEVLGASVLTTEHVRNIPHSVRENPGAYRSVYTGGRRYYSGK
jgi:hypothetical protein